jgi:ElaB/YqjD/DUF883 family membrane-anchored ribosome-binding protein
METNQTTPATRAAHASHAEHEATEPQRAPRARGKEDSLGEVLEETVRSVDSLYQHANAALQERAERTPYLTLGVAAGVGFIVGGGLASPLGQTLLRSSVRLFGPPILQALLNASGVAVDPLATTASHPRQP